MNVSTTSAAEPQTTATAELPVTGASDLAATTAPARRRFGRKSIAAAMSLVLVGVAVGTWLVFARSGPAGPRPLADAVEAAPVPPPAPFAATLDVAPATGDSAEAPAADVAGQLDRVTSLVATLAGEASRQAAENLIVLPGRQAVEQTDESVRHERWEVRLPPDVTLESYARQLDFFGIELGVIGGKNEIIYLSRLSDAEPKRRGAPATREGRLYMTWQRGALAEADRKLVAKAKLDVKGVVIAQFCPQRIEKELAELERAEAKKHKRAAVRKTVFGVRQEGQGFKFYVIEQQAGDEQP